MAKEDKNLEKQGTTAVTTGLPSYLAQYQADAKTGVEGLDKDLVQIPRIAIAQMLSPQMIPGDSKHIPDLKLGDMFDTLSNRILGPGPIAFAIIRRDKPRGIEFFPREQGGGVKDMNVPLNDPRMAFTRGQDGQSVKPVATRFHDYIIMTLPVDFENPFENVIALSMKSSQLNVSRILNGLTMGRGAAPIYAGKYTLKTVFQENKKGKFYNFSVSNFANPKTPEGWLTEQEAAAAKILFDGLKDKQVEFDRETDAGEDIDDGEIPDLTEPPSNTRM